MNNNNYDDKIMLSLNVDKNYLVDALNSCLDRDQLIDLVVGLDDCVQEWDFTLKLYDHFKKLKEEYNKEKEEAEDKEK